MTEQGPTPQRIGDAERDRAAELLREHMAEGRLTAEEFDERVDAALRARTAADLAPLFTDLPGARPGQGLATTPTSATASEQPRPVRASPVPAEPNRFNGPLAALTSVIWPITILFIVFGPSWASWWLIIVPVLVSGVLGKDHQDRDRERRKIEHEQERLDRRRRAIGD